jgi:hypothetical protein
MKMLRKAHRVVLRAARRQKGVIIGRLEAKPTKMNGFAHQKKPKTRR